MWFSNGVFYRRKPKRLNTWNRKKNRIQEYYLICNENLVFHRTEDGLIIHRFKTPFSKHLFS